MFFNKLYIVDPQNKNSNADDSTLSIELQREAFLYMKSLKFLHSYDLGLDEVTFTIMNEYDVEIYKNMCEKTNSHFEIVDISMDAVDGKLAKKYKDHKHILDDVLKTFISEYVEKDVLLDKILEFGVDSLTDLEKEVLSK